MTKNERYIVTKRSQNTTTWTDDSLCTWIPSQTRDDHRCCKKQVALDSDPNGVENFKTRQDMATEIKHISGGQSNMFKSN